VTARATTPTDIQINDPTHTTNNPVRIHVATDIDTLNPVATAKYAATHIGHFGNSASTAVGTTHFVVATTRRAFDVPLRVPWQHV
jgi:hypothetical protein